MGKAKPQVIEDEEYQRAHERVAAVDVAKASGMVCTRLPGKAGKARVSRVWEVTATMGAVTELGQELVKARIEKVTLEATSDYWRIWFYVLEMCGLSVQLVDPAQAKNLKGRPKTDKHDAMWLARLTEMGLLRPCFVPPSPVRALRDYTRACTDLVRERTRCYQRLEKLLEGALIKLSSKISKLTTATAKDIIKALIGGERDPHVLAGLARPQVKASHEELAATLAGMFDSHHGELAELELDQIQWLDQRITKLEVSIRGALAAIPESWGVDAGGSTGPGAGTGSGAAVLPAAARLDEIPGISLDLAHAIIAETGLDMTRFLDAAHLVSWAGLCPVSRQSGPAAAAAGKATATPTCAQPWARQPSAPPAPLPSSANATAGSPAAAAKPKPRSPSPAPSWSSSGTCSPTPPPATATSARTTSPPAPTATRKSAATSASSRPWDWRSPSPPPPNPATPPRSADGSAARPFEVEDFPVSHRAATAPRTG
ncbi:MAG: IS110 family transposase [Streptosporangiaceae bacterium]